MDHKTLVVFKRGTALRCPNFTCRKLLGVISHDILANTELTVKDIFWSADPKGLVIDGLRCRDCHAPFIRKQIYTDNGWVGGGL